VLGELDNRGAEDAEIEMPKAWRGKGMGRGVQPTRRSGGARSGAIPRRKRVFVYL